MARRCGCATESCACTVVQGDGIVVDGTGSPTNPYRVTSIVSEIETGFDVQYNNITSAVGVHRLDFRGSAVSVVPGTDEAVVTITVPDPVSGATIPAGVIWMYGNVTAPAGWLPCNGATYLIGDYPDLFAAIANRFGGDGTTNFKVPDFTNRLPVGATGLSTGTKPISQLVAPAVVDRGAETKKIGTTHLPPHSHTIAHDHPANVNNANPGGYWQTSPGNFNVPEANGNTSTGGGDVHDHYVDIGAASPGSSGNGPGTQANFDIMPPWLALGFIIKST